MCMLVSRHPHPSAWRPASVGCHQSAPPLPRPRPPPPQPPPPLPCLPPPPLTLTPAGTEPSAISQKPKVAFPSLRVPRSHCCRETEVGGISASAAFAVSVKAITVDIVILLQLRFVLVILNVRKLLKCHYVCTNISCLTFTTV